MRKQILRLALCALLNCLIVTAACAQGSSSRIDHSISIEEALSLVEAASPDSNNAGAIVLLDAIRTGRVPSRDQLAVDLLRIAAEGPTIGSRVTAFSVLSARRIPGGYLALPAAFGELIERTDDVGIAGMTIQYLGVHPDRSLAASVLREVALKEDGLNPYGHPELAVNLLAEMGEEGRAVLANLHETGEVAPSAREALAVLAQSGFRKIR